ncbi:MAG: NAD(P)H-dependent oxidoreductase [Bdellovibrionaceae bacterium]|nr:NAD(P)H-dependent oxidoreductase [Pseudobdellovibrionaceae bacterium]
MSRVDNEIIHHQLNWRYACKKFDPTKKIRESDWNVLLESLRLTASSYGLQPWKFIVVQSPGIRQQLLPASYSQSPTVDASHFVVLTYKEKLDIEHIEKFILQNAKVRGMEVAALDGFKNMMIKDLVQGPRSETINWWAQRQTYIAMGTMLTTAAMMEIDTLPMEGINQVEFDKILNLEGTGYKSIAAIACGYRAADDKYQFVKKVRFDMDDVVIVK